MAGLPPGAPMMRFPQQPLMQPPVGMPPLPMVAPRPPLMPIPPPVMMHPTMGLPPMPVMPRPTIQIQAPPTLAPEINKAKFKPVSVGEMQVATTVFVGNITDKATDTLVRQVLLRCGYIVGWKRVQDATGKLQAFGFCEYADPECALRAMRLLNGFTLGSKDMVVKVDSKNRKELLKYIVKKKRMKASQAVNEEEIEKEAQEIEEQYGADGLKQELGDDAKAEDKKVLQSIQTLVRDNIDILSSSKSSEESRRERDVEQSILAMAKQAGKIDEDSTLDDMDMDKEMMALVSDEISKFRQSYQNFEKEKAERRAKKDKERRERLERDRSKDRPTSDKNSEAERSRERSRSPRADKPRSPRTRSQERREREKEAERRREKERERMAREEEEYEQKQMEWKRRERDLAYKDKLKQWEKRESRKAREYDSLKEDDEHRKRKREKERKKLARFFEEYDDDEEDPSFYSGSELIERRRRREAEMDEDKRDRRREKEEREALHLQVIERRLREREEEERKRKEEAERRANMAAEENDEEDEDEAKAPDDDDDEEDDEDTVPVRTEIDENIPLTKPGYEPVAAGTSFPPIKVQAAPAVHSPTSNSSAYDGVAMEKMLSANQPPVTKVAFGISKRASATKSSLDGVFGGEDETDSFKPKMKKGLSLIHSAEGAQLAATISEVPPGTKISPEERKKLVQKLVNSIPTKRDDIFSWDLKWNMVDHMLMEKRIAPWINKKIVEYIGETDPDITDFLCNKLAEHVTADDLLRDFAVVMEDDAEVFILKLWRLLIYETEAKHLGIAKSY